LVYVVYSLCIIRCQREKREIFREVEIPAVAVVVVNIKMHENNCFDKIYKITFSYIICRTEYN